MQSSTRRVHIAVSRRLIAAACAFYLLIPWADARAETSLQTSVHLPSAGILEQHDPRLAQSAGPTSRPADAATPPASAGQALGPEAVSAGTTQPERQEPPPPENQQVLHRRPAPVGAARPADQDQAIQHPAAGVNAWPLWDALPLAVVLALIAGIALLVKKYIPVKRILTGAGVLDVVARLPLSSKQSLVLVRMGRRLVLVGVSPEGLTRLDVVEDPEQVAAIAGEVASRREDSMSRAFADALGGETNVYTDTAAGEDTSAAAGGAVRNLLDKVRRLTQQREPA